MAKLLLGDAGTPSTESTHEALSDHLVLHRPRTDSITSTASLDCLAEVAQRELDLRVRMQNKFFKHFGVLACDQSPCSFNTLYRSNNIEETSWRSFDSSSSSVI